MNGSARDPGELVGAGHHRIPDVGVRVGVSHRLGEVPEGHQPVAVLALDEALRELEEIDPTSAKLTMLRYFAGLTVEDTARAMGMSPRTVKRRWRYAKAWLDRRIHGEDPTPGEAAT